jgi:hypothetical protein
VEPVLVILLCSLMVAVEFLIALAVVAPQVVVRTARRVVRRLVGIPRERDRRTQEVR